MRCVWSQPNRRQSGRLCTVITAQRLVIIMIKLFMCYLDLARVSASGMIVFLCNSCNKQMSHVAWVVAGGFTLWRHEIGLIALIIWLIWVTWLCMRGNECEERAIEQRKSTSVCLQPFSSFFYLSHIFQKHLVILLWLYRFLHPTLSFFHSPPSFFFFFSQGALMVWR